MDILEGKQPLAGSRHQLVHNDGAQGLACLKNSLKEGGLTQKQHRGPWTAHVKVLPERPRYLDHVPRLLSGERTFSTQRAEDTTLLPAAPFTVGRRPTSQDHMQVLSWLSVRTSADLVDIPNWLYFSGKR